MRKRFLNSFLMSRTLAELGQAVWIFLLFWYYWSEEGGDMEKSTGLVAPWGAEFDRLADFLNISWNVLSFNMGTMLRS